MLIAMRNAMMAGKRLPYDAEVEYLESTGTQWIDTGVTATNNTHVNVRFSDYTVSGAWLFGTRKAYQNSALGVFVESGSANNMWKRAFGNYITPNPFTFSTIDLGVTTFDYDAGHFVATREKVPYTVDVTDTAPAFDSSPYSIYLWTLNNGGGRANVSHAKIYGFKIWESGVLVRDFIHVRFTNELGVSEGAMFDRANPTVGMNSDGSPRNDGLYLNRGSGAFGYGNDLKYPIPAE